MCEGQFLNKDCPPGEQAGRRRRGANWASFSGMSYVMVVTTWVDGEAESDVGFNGPGDPLQREKNRLGKCEREFSTRSAAWGAGGAGAIGPVSAACGRRWW